VLPLAVACLVHGRPQGTRTRIRAAPALLVLPLCWPASVSGSLSHGAHWQNLGDSKSRGQSRGGSGTGKRRGASTPLVPPTFKFKLLQMPVNLELRLSPGPGRRAPPGGGGRPSWSLPARATESPVVPASSVAGSAGLPVAGPAAAPAPGGRPHW
jgi:hypothetical protein